MVFLWIASKTYTKFRLCCATYIYRVCWRNTLSISALVIACTLRKIYYTATYQLCMHGHDICLSFQFLLSAIVVYWCGECFWSCCVSARWCSIWWSCSCWKLWLQFINGYLLRDACELLVTHVLIFFTVTHLPPQATIRSKQSMAHKWRSTVTRRGPTVEEREEVYSAKLQVICDVFCLDKISVFIHVWIFKVNQKIVSHAWLKSVICMPHPALYASVNYLKVGQSFAHHGICLSLYCLLSAVTIFWFGKCIRSNCV